MAYGNNGRKFQGRPVGRDMVTSAYRLTHDGRLVYDRREAEEAAGINGSRVDPEPPAYMNQVDPEALEELLAQMKKEYHPIGFDYREAQAGNPSLTVPTSSDIGYSSTKRKPAAD